MENAVKSPHLLLAKIIEKVKYIARKERTKKEMRAPKVPGSIYTIRRITASHRRRVIIKAGKKFLLLTAAACTLFLVIF